VSVHRVAIVTGAGRGIGRAVAERLAGDGAAVVIAELSDDGAEVAQALTATGATALYLPVDVADPQAVDEMVEQAHHAFGRIDVLVNNAAVSPGGSFLETEPDTWLRTLGVNLTGPFLCGRAVARRMVAGGIEGRIVNVASINSFAAERGAASYVASKGGLAALTRAMAVDLAPHGIRVNAVAPGPIRTEVTAPLFDAPAYREGIARGVPLRRAGGPDEVAAVVAFLAGDDASFVNGATLVADGGYLAYIRLDEPCA
jgi:NAD(P)-dependent dehydrogenase (short-subunit alcohol dehydrogenase family)